jgi:hypothetical protein
MKKVIIFTGSAVNCGIFQYVNALAEVFNSESKKYNFLVLMADSKEEAENLILQHQPHAVIYNYHPSTLSWIDSGFTRLMKNQLGLKQVMIVGHESSAQYVGVDDYIFTDPRINIDQVNVHSGVPTIMYYDDIVYSPPSWPLKIGTSGISGWTKNIPKMIGMINEQITEDVIVNLHMVDGRYVDPTGRTTQEIMNLCNSIAKSNIQINLNRTLMPKKDLIRWLNHNDINLYMYNSGATLGVSSSINNALSAKKPFGVNGDHLFSHVRRDYNDIEKVSIKSIIETGIEPHKEFYDQWNPKTLVDKYEFVLERQ